MRRFLMLLLGAVALSSIALAPVPASAGHHGHLHWHGGHVHWHGGHVRWHGRHWHGYWGPRWGWGWGPRVYVGPRYRGCWAPGYGWVPCWYYW
jgi:hypothetical protein